MTAPRLVELREPPLVGRKYLVPFVRAYWSGKEADWPVMGPAHTDREFFNFAHRHYHIDARFVSGRMLRGTGYPVDDIVQLTQRFPLSGSMRRQADGSYGPSADAIPTGRPQERSFQCMRVELPYHFGGEGPVQQLREKHGNRPCPPIELPDGRKLCPHRKVDLSNLLPNAEGVVTCPLHGLQVRVRETAA